MNYKHSINPLNEEVALFNIYQNNTIWSRTPPTSGSSVELTWDPHNYGILIDQLLGSIFLIPFI